LDVDSLTYLPGTSESKDKMLEPEMIDRYVKDGALEKQQFEVLNLELW